MNIPAPGGTMARMRGPVAVMALVACLAVTLAACGFQLRGVADLPAGMAETRIEVADDTTLFIRELKLLLEANQVRLVDNADARAALLRIDRQRIDRRALAIGGDARVREFELVFELQFSLADADGEILIPRETLRLVRDFRFDEQEILAATREEELLREDLRRTMAARLVRRLEAAGR